MNRLQYELQRFEPEDYQFIRVSIAEPQEEIRGPRFWREHRKRRARADLTSRIREELVSFLDGYGDNMLFYEDSPAADDWLREVLPLPEFEGYLQRTWVRRLLSRAVNPHFVVLGNVPYLHELLGELAPRMKSVLWIAPDLTYQEQLEEFAEDFYQEYGLAIRLYFLPDNGTYAQMRIPEDRYREPVTVLDFTGDKYIPSFEPLEGSVWLDMASVLEKERRIEARRLKAAYISLKKQWRDLSRDSGNLSRTQPR